ncbi:MAG: hypothetical protein HC897_06345 [Thermoanaerobaculia bacterium]|nr:hypothetical protein [Thermoanaerobaculia bacterium]
MMKALHLGHEGEAAAQLLLSAYELSDVFEPCLLFSPFPQALAEVRRRLAEVAGRVERWEPSEDLLERTLKFVETVDPKAPRPVIWLEQETFAPEPWQLAFRSLNWSRETYRDIAPWMWVFAGPDELLNVFRDRAPDLFGGVAVRRRLKEKPVLAPVGGTMRWLHLSDFHFERAERWDRRATLLALVKQAEQLKAEGLAPDWVFIIGDVAWSGQKLEYQQAELFFRELAEKLGLDPAKDFFLVPGNHDVDRSAIGRGEEILLAGLQDEETVEEVFRDGRQMDLLSRRLEHFYAFTERLLGPARAWRPARPWRVDVREVGTAQVAILQLNSAWASGPKDETQRVLVGEYQLREALEEASEALLRIALVHHPMADLRAFDASKAQGLLGAPGGAHFLLRGHLHEEQSVIHGSPEGSLVELAAGAVYTGGRWPRAFLATEVDLTAGAGTVHFFGYSDRGNGFWRRDPKAYERAPEGIWRFRLPAGLALGEATPAPIAKRGGPA